MSDDVRSKIESISRRLADMHPGPARPKLARIRGLLADSLRMMLEKASANPLATGFVDLDDHIGELRRGTMTLLAADAGVGKSTVATQAALHASANGHGVVYLNLEMSPELYGIRTVANFVGVAARRALARRMSAEEYQRMLGGFEAIGRLCGDRVVMGNHGEHRTVQGITTLCKEAKAQLEDEGVPLRLVVVDHVLQVMVSVRAGDKDAEGKARADMLKELAESLGVHVLALMHVTREGSKMGTMPTKNHLAGGEWYGRHADNILMFHQKRSKDGTFAPEPGILSCQKSRWGEPFAVALEYRSGSFHPWSIGADGPPPPPPTAERHYVASTDVYVDRRMQSAEPHAFSDLLGDDS